MRILILLKIRTVHMKHRLSARIASFILSVALILSSITLLSSCLYTGGTGDGTSDGTDTDGEGANTNGSGVGTGTGSDLTDNANDTIPEFLPGFGESDIANVDLTSSSRALLSSVSILSHFERYYGSDFGYTYDEGATQAYKVNGSGVIYKLDREAGDAYIITNFHVVSHYESITPGGVSDDIDVYLYGQENKNYVMEATYVGGSMTQDIAVLKIEDSEVLRHSYALPLTAANSSLVSTFDTVVAIGNSEGEGIQATSGIISVDNEDLSLTGADHRTTITLNVMRISAAINEGNSGGGLFNTEGKLIGIVVAKKIGSDVDNVAYAIPANRFLAMADSIIDSCNGTTETSLSRCMLGFTMNSDVKGIRIDPETGKIHKVSLVKVDTIVSGSILEGKLATGDVIKYVIVDGERIEITQIYMLIEHMFKARVGSTVTLGIERDGIAASFTVTMTEATLSTVK